MRSSRISHELLVQGARVCRSAANMQRVTVTELLNAVFYDVEYRIGYRLVDKLDVRAEILAI